MTGLKMKHIKSILFISFIVFVLPIMCSCNTDKTFMCYDSEKYVNLYDYSKEVVSADYLEITDEDVKMIVEAELSTNEIYIENTSRTKAENGDILSLNVDGELQYYFLGDENNSEEVEQKLINSSVGESINLETSSGANVPAIVCGIYRTATIDDDEFILNYYGYSNWDEFESFIRNRASNEIIYNLLFDKISKESKILKVPKEIQIQIEKEIEQSTFQILQNYYCLEDYLNDNGISYEEFESSISQYYYELMIYKAILDHENLTVTVADINQYRLNNSIDNNYSDYYIYQQLASEMARQKLVDAVKITK